MSTFLGGLEWRLKRFVVDETGLRVYYRFEQPPNDERIEQFLKDNRGLQLSPAKRTVEMLVVDSLEPPEVVRLCRDDSFRMVHRTAPKSNALAHRDRLKRYSDGTGPLGHRSTFSARTQMKRDDQSKALPVRLARPSLSDERARRRRAL